MVIGRSRRMAHGDHKRTGGGWEITADPRVPARSILVSYPRNRKNV